MAVPALSGAFPGSALVASGCLVFAPWLGQSCVPRGSLGMGGGGVPLPHTPPGLAPLCLLRALPAFRSPLENLLRTACSRCARETGRGNQALNKEQRFNVLAVCALSLGLPPCHPAGGTSPSPWGFQPLSFPGWPMPWLNCTWPDPQHLSPSAGDWVDLRCQQMGKEPLSPQDGCKGLSLQIGPWGTSGAHCPANPCPI